MFNGVVLNVEMIHVFRYYLWELARFLVLSLSFILGFILWGNSANWLGMADPYSDPVEVS